MGNQVGFGGGGCGESISLLRKGNRGAEPEDGQEGLFLGEQQEALGLENTGV